MSKKLIDVELYQYETLVFGKVLYTDKSLIKKEMILLAKDNGYCIASSRYPYINFDSLCLWGENNDLNNNVIFNKFHTIKEANEWIKNIKQLLDKINKQDEIKADDVKRVI